MYVDYIKSGQDRAYFLLIHHPLEIDFSKIKKQLK
jgi:hypothetical protein